jgi:hypothetical protein
MDLAKDTMMSWFSVWAEVELARQKGRRRERQAAVTRGVLLTGVLLSLSCGS